MNKWLFTSLVLFSACSSPSGPSMMRPPATVQVTRPIEKEIPIYIEAIGNIFPYFSVDIRPQIQGKLLITHVKNGQTVKQGDLLFTIDTGPYQAAFDKAQANLLKNVATLKFAQQKLDRYGKLSDQNYVSQQSMEDYRNVVETTIAQLEIDKAEIEMAQVNLDYCFIHSPIIGRLGNLPTDPGNLVASSDSTPLAKVEQLVPAKVYFNLPQKQFLELRQVLHADKVSIEVSHPNHNDIMEGYVDFFDNVVELNTGTILLKGVIPNENVQFWPGEFVQVKVLLRKEPKAFLIPSSSLQQGIRGTYVYVIKPDMTAEVREVNVIAKLDDQVAVTDGITIEDQVVIQGQLNLYPGTKAVILPGHPL